MVTLADADLVASDTLAAATVTVAGDGTVAGAVYSPLEEMVPHAAPLHPSPETVQSRPVFDVPVTEAVNCCVVPVVVVTLVGVNPTATSDGGAIPEPLRATTIVPSVEESLVMVRCPVAAPMPAGLNCTFGVTASPGRSVCGNVTPEMVKPAPSNVAPLIVTSAVPVAVNVTDCVAGVFTSTSPKATLVAFAVNVLAAAAGALPAVVQPVTLMAQKQARRITRAEFQRWSRAIGVRRELPLKGEELHGANSGFGERVFEIWDT